MKHLPNLVPKHWLSHRIWLSSTVRWEVSTDHAWWNFRIISNFIFSGFSLAHLDYGLIPKTLASWFDLVLSSWHILRNLEHKEFRSKHQPFTENPKDHYFILFHTVFSMKTSHPQTLPVASKATRKKPWAKNMKNHANRCKEGGSSERVKEWVPNILPPEPSFFIFSWGLKSVLNIISKLIHHMIHGSLRPEGRFVGC